MNTFMRSALGLLLGAAVTALSVGAAFAAPLADRLERPSRLSPEARQAPLTDVQSIGGRLVMLGADGHILLLETDGSMSQARVPVDLLLTAVHFVDARSGWAVGHDGVILHSADGGQTWTRQLDGSGIGKLMLDWAEAEVARLEVASAAAPDDEALGEALDNASFALDDAQVGAAAGASRPLLDVWFRDSVEGWAVGAYGMVVHTTDGGRSWAFVHGLDNPERLHLNAVLGLVDGSLLVAGEGGHLYRQWNGQWQTLKPPTQASIYKLLQLANGRLLAMGFGGALFESGDSGQHWQAIPVPARAGLYGAEQLADGGVLFAAGGGLVLYSQDLRRFQTWLGSRRTAWMASASSADGQLALVGGSGLRVMPLAEFKEQLK